MKFFIILAVYFSLNMSSALADNNLKEERDKITKERNDLAIGWRDNLGYSLPMNRSMRDSFPLLIPLIALIIAFLGIYL